MFNGIFLYVKYDIERATTYKIEEQFDAINDGVKIQLNRGKKTQHSPNFLTHKHPIKRPLAVSINRLFKRLLSSLNV
jgi:hypothetical protein